MYALYIYLLSSLLLFYYYYIDDLCNPVMANLEMVYYCFANITLSSAQGVNALESLGKLFKYCQRHPQWPMRFGAMSSLVRFIHGSCGKAHAENTHHSQYYPLVN